MRFLKQFWVLYIRISLSLIALWTYTTYIVHIKIRYIKIKKKKLAKRQNCVLYLLAVVAQPTVPTRVADASIVDARAVLAHQLAVASVRFGPTYFAVVALKSSGAFALVHRLALAAVQTGDYTTSWNIKFISNFNIF